MVTLPTAQTTGSAFPGKPLLHKPGGCDSSFTTDRWWNQKTSEHRGASGEDAGFPWPSVPSVCLRATSGKVPQAVPGGGSSGTLLWDPFLFSPI